MADSKTPLGLVAVRLSGNLPENDFEGNICSTVICETPASASTLQGRDHLTNSVFGNRHSGDTEMIPQHSRACPLQGGLHETR